MRNFGLMTGAILAVLFGLFLPWIFDQNLPIWPWIVSAILAFCALLLPLLLLPIYKVWMTVGHTLGWINTRIILGILFYALFLPVGLFMRLLGKDPLARKLHRERKTSYRIHCQPKNIDQMKEPY